MEGGGGIPAPHFLRKKFFFFHIYQTYIPTAIYIDIVSNGVILLKAFVGYTNVLYK
jgi:hypothetical protein